MVVSFSIEVSSTGRALSVVVNNEDEFYGSREKAVLKVAVSALKNSLYTPAVRNGLSVVSVLDQNTLEEQVMNI